MYSYNRHRKLNFTGSHIVYVFQQDVYINRAKVREFQFQIDNLFGCFGKPFSCDVEIRHSDQITVLPIEIEVSFSQESVCMCPHECVYDLLCECDYFVYTHYVNVCFYQSLFILFPQSTQ